MRPTSPLLDRARAGRMGVLVGLGLLLVSCGGNSGVGLFGDYNGKLNIETGDVATARQQARIIVEEGHRGQLEKEDTTFPTKFLWVVGRDDQAVLTFRVPAEEFDATLVDLDSASLGKIVDRDVTGRDDIERRSDLSEVSQIIDDRLSDVINRDGEDEEVINAQERLADMADLANRPVIVVQLHPGRGFLDWVAWFIFNRVLWVGIAVFAGYSIGQKSKEAHTSVVMTNDDERQNSPEKNPGVQDRGSSA
ncbi:MAG: DUF4349 domain-containing protein [Microthrixaceae bacterium]